MNIQEKALAIALTQEGVQEQPKGSNAGEKVELYLKSVGLPKGNPWCMGFVYWCFEQAAKEMKVKNPLYKTGHVLTAWNERKNILGVKNPMPGDVFIMRFAHGTGHTGIVSKVVGDTVETIEGNTNDDGSREGFIVCRHKRKIASIVGFLRSTKAI